MGLNVKDIQLRLFKVVHDSAKSSYSFIRRHPVVSGASLVCFILYAFLSYIYSFLVYISPFLVCAVIFIKIFWSSEQTQLKYVKKKEEKEGPKKVESKCPKIPNDRRTDMLFKYPSQNAISRRRNLSDKNWDVYGGLEDKAKDLSAVFHNEFTKRNIQIKGFKSFEKGESSLDNKLSSKKSQTPKRQMLRSEPSMVDLVECADLLEIEKRIEDGDDDDDGEETQEESKKAIEWTEDDQKNLMYLGNSEMERNIRLESLVARRRARKTTKGKLEKDLNNKKSTAPSFMPRNPYDIPYDPFKEKPNLTGDSFPQEFSSQKNMSLSRHEGFSTSHIFPSETQHDHGAREHCYFNKGKNYSDRPEYSRFRRNHTDKGTHDWLIDQLTCNEGGESRLQTLIPLTKAEKSRHEEDGKCKTDMENMKDENDHDSKSMSGQNSEAGSDRSGPGPRFPKPHGRLLTFPATTPSIRASNINEALFDTVTSVVDKRQESMFLNNGRICHTPTYSVASDLQVEVSEMGSPTSTVDENAETNSSSTDRDSILYDGDIDRDISSGSEDLWGSSFHGGKVAQGVRREGEYNPDLNDNSKDVVPLVTPRHIDGNAADVSSMSSKSDGPEDTPTYPINSHHNFFGFMKHPVGETEAPQSSNSSHVVDQLPNETHSEKPEEWCNMPENVTDESYVINDINNSGVTEEDNTENLRNNEGPSTSVMRQESVDETSNYSVSSSPRSVLPEKTMADDVSPTTFDLDALIDAQQSIMEGLAQEPFNSESTPDTIPQTIQPMMDHATDESHNVDFNHSQEQTNPLENSNEESNVFGSMNDEQVSNMEEKDNTKNDDNNEDNSDHLNRHEATTESTTPINEITSLEDRDEKSRDLVDDKVPSRELIEDNDNDDKPSSSNDIQKELQRQRVTEPTVHNKE